MELFHEFSPPFDGASGMWAMEIHPIRNDEEDPSPAVGSVKIPMKTATV